MELRYRFQLVSWIMNSELVKKKTLPNQIRKRTTKVSSMKPKDEEHNTQVQKVKKIASLPEVEC